MTASSRQLNHSLLGGVLVSCHLSLLSDSERWPTRTGAITIVNCLLCRRQTRRKRARESILAGIRRHYGSALNVLSYIALGLVLYAGVVAA